MMARTHLLLASAALGLDGRTAHHLRPPVRHVGAMLFADAPPEHRRDLRRLEFHKVIEPVQPAGKRVAPTTPAIDRRGHVTHDPHATQAPPPPPPRPTRRGP